MQSEGPGPAAVRLQTLLAAVWLGFICGHVTADQNLTQILQRITGTPSKLPPVTCRLLIEGGTNATEVRLYGTSISRAELECTGGIITVSIHPLLIPFAEGFMGVDIAPSAVREAGAGAAEARGGRNLLQTDAAGQGSKERGKCGIDPKAFLLTVCGDTWALFDKPRIVDVPANVQNGMPRIMTGVLNLNAINPVLLVEPVLHNVELPVITSTATAVVIGGRVENTRGIAVTAMSGDRAVFFRTVFVSNWAAVWGGAVTLMLGSLDCIECQFNSNRAMTLAELNNGNAVALLRSGMGGAVLGYQMQGANGTSRGVARFVGCSFHNNSAYDGGAVALIGANATFENCTFSNNTAVQNGLDVFSSLGGNLSFKGSSISLASRSVDWQRVNASQCMRGEYFGDRVCRRCAVSTYSLTVPSFECQTCPPNAQCPGGDAILPTSGHWRVSNESAQVVSCPRASTCLDGGTCATGHTGIVCGSCQGSYALAMPFRCVKCQSTGAAVGFFLASLFALLLLAGIGIQLTITSNREAAAAAAGSVLGLAPPTSVAQQDPSAGHVLKILTLFLQYVAIMGTLPVPFPPVLLGLTSTANGLFAGGAAWFTSPFECVLQGASVPAPIAKLLVHLSMPLIVAAVECIVFSMVYMLSGRRKRRQLPITVVLLVSAFFTLPGWVQAVFSFFNCYGIQDPTLTYSLWWVPHMAQACYIGYHRIWALGLGVPCLILCCAIPAAMLIGLWRNRKRLSERSFCESYGHLYCLYKKRAFWWECVILGQTIVLVALSIFATQIGTYIVVLLVGMHLVLALQLLHFVKPYASDPLQWLHVGSLGCLLLDVFVALLMFAQPALPMRTRDIGIGQIAAAFLAVFLNVALVLFCCVLIVRSVFRGPGGTAIRSMIARCGKGGRKPRPSHTPGST